MGERHTENQNKLAEGIIQLLELYNSDEFLKHHDEWCWDKIGESLSKFFMALYYKCIYSPKYKSFDITRKKEVTYINEKKFISDRDTVININTKELINFLNIMKLLRAHTIKKEFVHFDIKFIVDKIETGFSGPVGDGILNRGSFWEKNVSAKVDKTAVMALKTQTTYAEGILGKVGTSSFSHRTLYVSHLSNFGEKLLKINSQKKGFDAIPSLSDSDCNTFFSIMRSTFVHFHMAFGNFERIKACAYCQKLFFEKRKGSGKFCSSKCRKENFNASEPEEKRKCRDKQNAWIRYKIRNDVMLQKHSKLYPDTVFKDECERCTKYVKSGECLVLKKKNIKAIKILNLHL